MLIKDESPLSKGYQPVIWNFELLAHDMLGGFGGMGEGMSVQIAPDGRRIIWLAHESAPIRASRKWSARLICRTPICGRIRSRRPEI
jgi:hypothetical protein